MQEKAMVAPSSAHEGTGVPAVPTKTSQASSEQVQPLIIPMRWFLWSATIVAFIAGCSLYFLSERTDRYFSWTINSALTAALLGAAYLTGRLVEYLASRERVWARARVVVPAITLIFTPLLLLTTLLHFTRFHMGDITGWAWLIIYLLDPVIAAILFIWQVRVPGIDPPRVAPLPRWMRITLAIQGSIMLVFGTLMFVAPEVFDPLWPWALIPLTARAVGTAVLTMGIVAMQAAWENDLSRVRSCDDRLCGAVPTFPAGVGSISRRDALARGGSLDIPAWCTDSPCRRFLWLGTCLACRQNRPGDCVILFAIL